MFKIIVATVSALLTIATACADDNEDSIRHLLHSTFDKPESPLVVDPVVISGSHAIAGWSQGDLGGRALFRSREGKWTLVLCSGDGIKSADALRQTGIPAPDAASLAGKLADAERKISPARLALFAKFEGTVMMDAAGNHPPMAQHAQTHAAPTTFKGGGIVVSSPWVRATPQGAQVAAGYMKVTNTGTEPDRLVGGTLDLARRFEIHEMAMVGNVMQMRPLAKGIEIKPGETVELKPGGLHIMGLDLSGRYTQGGTVKGTLIFEKAGTIPVEYKIGPIGGEMHH
jgi:copper(I)-binding protein